MASELLLRWPDGESRPEALLRQIQIDRIVTPPPDAITDGLWPGISRGPTANRDDESASASRNPWVDANGYLVHYHRALGKQNVLLAQQPPPIEQRVTPFETNELALVEARVYGGNFLLSPDSRYREGLLKSDPKALAAWQSLGVTALWLKEHEALFGQQPLPTITMLVEPGDTTAEFANLLARHAANPFLTAAVPKPSPQILALVAVGLKQVPRAAFDHARAGSTLIIDSKPDPAWRSIRQDKDRTVYSLGKGQVVVYHEEVTDPSEFALDVIDIVTHKRRSARLWNALAAIPLATPAPGGVLLHVINYGSPVRAEVQARIQGHFRKATLIRPGHPDSELKAQPRGPTSEVLLPRLDIVATVRFFL